MPLVKAGRNTPKVTKEVRQVIGPHWKRPPTAHDLVSVERWAEAQRRLPDRTTWASSGPSSFLCVKGRHGICCVDLASRCTRADKNMEGTFEGVVD